MQNQFKQLCKMTAICTLLMSTLSFGALAISNLVLLLHHQCGLASPNIVL